MKKLLTWAVLVTAIALSSCKYDDDDLWNSVHGLEDRVAKLEELFIVANDCRGFGGE